MEKIRKNSKIFAKKERFFLLPLDKRVFLRYYNNIFEIGVKNCVKGGNVICIAETAEIN